MSFEEDLREIFGEESQNFSPTLQNSLRALWTEGVQRGVALEQREQLPLKRKTRFVSGGILFPKFEILMPSAEYPSHLLEKPKRHSHKPRNHSILDSADTYRGVVSETGDPIQPLPVVIDKGPDISSLLEDLKKLMLQQNIAFSIPSQHKNLSPSMLGSILSVHTTGIPRGSLTSFWGSRLFPVTPMPPNPSQVLILDPLPLLKKAP